MKNRDYLKQAQPIFYRVIERSFRQHRQSHAYLIVGDHVEQAVLFLAQSLICQQDDLACEECSDCKRIANLNYADLIVFDGSKQSIKKEDIDYIQKEFSKSALEDLGKVYILKNVDHSSNVAMNSLLKFLEEPVEDVYAILTTSNLNKVLPTIQSRCQVIHLLTQSQDIMRKALIQADVSEEDASILSCLYTDQEEALNTVARETFNSLKIEVLNFIEDLYQYPDNLLFNQQINVSRNYSKDKDTLALYLRMLVLGMKDLLHVKHHAPLTFCDHQEFFEKMPDDPQVLERIEIILDTLYYLDMNANTQLLIDGMINQVLEEK